MDGKEGLWTCSMVTWFYRVVTGDIGNWKDRNSCTCRLMRVKAIV